jgi:HK97 family phage major capsid protein/HK97 family phage prohead protease
MIEEVAPPPREGYRAMSWPAELRAEDGQPPRLVGHFARYGVFNEIDSAIEGRFMERIDPGAFSRTFKNNRDRIRVLFQHGKGSLGESPIATVTTLRSDSTGPYYEAELLDGVPPLILDGLRKGQYGVSYRFQVEREDWEPKPTRSPANPKGLPERTIREAKVFEFGPVTFPADAGADIAVRSLSDEMAKRTALPRRLRRSIDDLAAFLLADKAALQAAIDKLGNGEPLMAQEAEMLEAAIEHLEPPDADEDDMTMSSLPRHSPVAPSDELAASPHPVDEARDEPDPPPGAAVIAATDPPEGGSSDSGSKRMAEPEQKYFTLEDMGARVRELDEAIGRDAKEPELSNAEEVAHEARVTERSELRLKMAKWQARIAAAGESAKDPERTVEPYAPSPVASFVRKTESDIYDFDAVDRVAKNLEHRAGLYRDNAMRATEIASFPNPYTDVERTRDRIATILDHHDTEDHQFGQRVMATGSPLYRRAFRKMLMGQPLTPEEQRGTALAVGVDGTGGFTVPFAFDPTIIAIGIHTGAINPYRRACRVVPIVGTDTWNAVTATVVTATRTTEAAPAIEQGPTFAQPQYIVTRVQAQVTYSFEEAQDRPDIDTEMARLIGEAKDNEEENQFAIGVGGAIGPAVAPIGVCSVYGTSGAYTQMDTIGSTVLAAADAYAVEAALPVRHRLTAQWFMNRANIRKFQALETTGGILFNSMLGYPAVGSPDNATDGNTGLKLLGYPVNESPSAPTAGTSHIIVATLCAPSSYVIVERVGMTVRLISDIINSSALATGQSAVYAMWRNTAHPLNVDAGRMLDYKT